MDRRAVGRQPEGVGVIAGDDSVEFLGGVASLDALKQSGDTGGGVR